MMNLHIAREVQKLEKNIKNLPTGSQKFARDLCDKAYKWNPSEKQAFWIRKLANYTPANVEVENVDLTKIVELFQVAGQKLKYPKVRLASSGGSPVQFKVAGPNSKYRGEVVISDGGPFGNNVWYGNISTSGVWRKTSRVSDEIAELVKEFADDPAATVSKYGRTVGNCSFCSKALDDERSLEVGYGPVCARNYNLPWG